MQDGMHHATDVRIVQCTLVSSTGVSVGLQDILTELNLFEDLFSPVMTGNILLADSNDLINKLPIIGYEYLLITFEKPGSPLQFKKTFRVYKMTDRQRVTEQHETYLLHFASEELILSENVLISRAYRDMPISAIITDIAKTYLQVKSTKMITMLPTTGSLSVMIPGWHPFYAINYLNRFAISTQYRSPSYVWYEDREGFHYMSLEALSQQSVIQSILIAPKQVGFERDPRISDMQIAQESTDTVSFPECFDTLRNTYSGMYAGLLISIDPLHRRITTTSYNALNTFQHTQHLNKYPIFSDTTNRFARTAMQCPESQKTTVMIHPFQEQRIHRKFYMLGIHSTRISAIIPGSVHLRVGSVVSVKLPNSEEQEQGGRKLDVLYSGKYLITALRHKITKRTYACIAELSKDSLLRPLPDASEQTVMNELKRQ